MKSSVLFRVRGLSVPKVQWKFIYNLLSNPSERETEKRAKILKRLWLHLYEAISQECYENGHHILSTNDFKLHTMLRCLKRPILDIFLRQDQLTHVKLCRQTPKGMCTLLVHHLLNLVKTSE